MPDFPLPPGSTIGILGGGQLGRMLALAAARLGFDTAILDNDPDGPAARVASRSLVGDYEDPAVLSALSDVSDIITFEFENVPAAAVEHLTALGASVAPGGRALAVAQDRFEEKSFLNAAGLATVPFGRVETEGDLRTAIHRLGAPLLLKTRRGGYDGKGQVWVKSLAGAGPALAQLGGQSCIAEGPADFRREVAMVGARGRSGEIALYPLTESHHENGILRRASAPARATPRVLAEAERIAATLLTALDYVGVLAVELFERDDGKLLVNEFAPRVHNTGHWTLDGCEVDQFEQHIRAIAGWPLGPTAATHHVEMTNLLGDEAETWSKISRGGREPDLALRQGGGPARPQDGPRQPADPAGALDPRRPVAHAAEDARGLGGEIAHPQAGLPLLERHHAGDPAVEMGLGGVGAGREADAEGGDQDFRQQDALGIVVLVRRGVARPAPKDIGALPGKAQAKRDVRRQGEEARPASRGGAVGHGGVDPGEDGGADALADLEGEGIDLRQRVQRRPVVLARRAAPRDPGRRWAAAAPPRVR